MFDFGVWVSFVLFFLKWILSFAVVLFAGNVFLGMYYVKGLYVKPILLFSVFLGFLVTAAVVGISYEVGQNILAEGFSWKEALLESSGVSTLY